MFNNCLPTLSAMKTKSILLSLLAITTMISFGQHPALELTFTAVNNQEYVQLYSIKVMNQTQGGDTVLYWPDTVLSIYFTGIPEPEQQAPGFKVWLVKKAWYMPLTFMSSLSNLPFNRWKNIILTM